MLREGPTLILPINFAPGGYLDIKGNGWEELRKVTILVQLEKRGWVSHSLFNQEVSTNDQGRFSIDFPVPINIAIRYVGGKIYVTVRQVQRGKTFELTKEISIVKE